MTSRWSRFHYPTEAQALDEVIDWLTAFRPIDFKDEASRVALEKRAERIDVVKLAKARVMR